MIKTGLVLGGGGSRGAYQIGVWQALRELNVKIDVVTGTSIGALNGALMVQEDYKGACDLWAGMNYDKVMSGVSSKPFDTYKDAGHTFLYYIRKLVEEGGMDIAPLENTVRSMLDEEKVMSSPMEYGLVTVEFPAMKEVALSKHDIPKGKMADYMLASAACYPAFKSRSIDNTKYIDGGYRNNLPIDLAVELGANEVIAVDLESVGEYAQPSYKSIPIRYIRSYWDLGLFLSFERSLLDRNQRLGYLDVFKSYRLLDGTAYAFKKGQKEVLYEDVKPYLGFAEKLIGLSFNDARGPVDKAVRSSLIKAMDFNPKSNINVKEYLIRTAELAGECMGIDPTEIYEMKDFNEKILSLYKIPTDITFKDLENNMKDPKSLSRLGRLLGNYEQREIVDFVYENMDKEFRTDDGVNLKLLASVVPKEFLAAGYIFYLENKDNLLKFHEKTVKHEKHLTRVKVKSTVKKKIDTIGK